MIRLGTKFGFFLGLGMALLYLALASTVSRALSQKRYTRVRLAKATAIIPVKTTTLIQMKIWMPIMRASHL